MKVYITARGLYAVEVPDRTFETFSTLLNANAFIRSQNEVPVYTWFN